MDQEQRRAPARQLSFRGVASAVDRLPHLGAVAIKPFRPRAVEALVSEMYGYTLRRSAILLRPDASRTPVAAAWKRAGSA